MDLIMFRVAVVLKLLNVTEVSWWLIAVLAIGEAAGSIIGMRLAEK